MPLTYGTVSGIVTDVATGKGIEEDEEKETKGGNKGKNGAGDGIRTHDNHVGNVMLYP